MVVMRFRYVIILLSILSSVPVAAQIPAPATIFEFFGVSPKTCKAPVSLNSKKEPPVNWVSNDRREEILHSQTKELQSIKAYLPDIAAHLAKVNAAGLSKQQLFSFSHGTKKATVYLDNGNYSLYDDNNKLIWTKSFLHVMHGGNAMIAWVEGNDNCEVYDVEGRLIMDKKFPWCSFGAGYFTFAESPGKMGVMDQNGRILFSGKYEYISPMKQEPGRYYMAGNGVNTMMLDAKGKVVLAMERPRLFSLFKEHYVFQDGSVYNLQTGEELFCNIPEPITMLDSEAGILSVKHPNGWQAFFDVTGKIMGLTEPNWVLTTAHGYTIGWVEKPVDPAKGQCVLKKGLVDKQFQWLLPPIYCDLAPLDSHYYRFSMQPSSLRYGLIDKNGKQIIPEGRFRNIRSLERGQYFCSTDSVAYIFSPADSSFRELDKHYWDLWNVRPYPAPQHYITYIRNSGWFILDKNFRALPLPPMTDAKWMPSIQKYQCRFKDSTSQYGMFGRQNFFYYSDTSGNLFSKKINDTTHRLFQMINPLGKGVLYVLPDGRYFVQISAGKVFELQTKTLPHYDSIMRCYITRDDGRVQLIDEEGSAVTPPAWGRMGYYDSNTDAVLATVDGKETYMDLQGKLLFDDKYDHLSMIDRFIVYARLNGKWGLVHRDGRVLLPLRYPYVHVAGDRVMYGENDDNYKVTFLHRLLQQPMK